VQAPLKDLRGQLVQMIQPLYLSASSLTLQGRAAALHAFCTATASSRDASSPLSDTESDALVLAAWQHYSSTVQGLLKPHLCRVEMAAIIASSAQLLLGSNGGFGHNWGNKLSENGQTVIPLQEDGPQFTGPFGPTLLKRLQVEYGPMWMDIDLNTVSADFFSWRAPFDTATLGGFFVTLDGTLNLDNLWFLPEQFDILAPHHYPKELEVLVYAQAEWERTLLF
jgi:hypothetical protein